LTLGAAPKAIAEAERKPPAAMGDDDLKSYRRLLVMSDDWGTALPLYGSD